MRIPRWKDTIVINLGPADDNEGVDGQEEENGQLREDGVDRLDRSEDTKRKQPKINEAVYK